MEEVLVSVSRKESLETMLLFLVGSIYIIK